MEGVQDIVGVHSILSAAPARPLLGGLAALGVLDAPVVRLLLVFLALVVKVATRTADHSTGGRPSPRPGSDPDDGAANDGAGRRTLSGVRVTGRRAHARDAENGEGGDKGAGPHVAIHLGSPVSKLLHAF